SSSRADMCGTVKSPMVLHRASSSGQNIRGSPLRIGRQISTDQLATRFRRSSSTVTASETAPGLGFPSQPNNLSGASQHLYMAIRRALEAAGVEFIDEDGGGPGVRLRKRQGKKV